MSNALALGAVSSVLCNVLDNGLIGALPAVGSPVTVSAKAPDLIRLDDVHSGPQLNLFLYRVSPNPGWRNAELPSRDSAGRRITNPPLALDLHYLLTAYGRDDLVAEILLGYGMHLLHERPFLDRGAIRKALDAVKLDTTQLPEAFRSPPNAGLADQLETLNITLEPLDVDVMSKIWSAVQSHYRPSAAYQVSVVLIEATYPAGEPLPVLTRTLGVEPSLVVPLPAIESVSAPDGTAIAEVGEPVTLHGHHLAGTAITILLGHRLLGAPHKITVVSNADEKQLTFTVPASEPVNQPWPAGTWNVSATLTPQGFKSPRTTNTVAFSLAPAPNGKATLTRNQQTQRVSISVPIRPRVRPEQTVTVALDSAQATVGPRTLPVDHVEAQFAPIPDGPAWLRLRVDGVASRLIDDSGDVPAFRLDRQVTVP